MRGFSRSNLFYMRAFAAAWNLSDTTDRARGGDDPAHVSDARGVRQGFAFYGRQFHLDAQGGDFYIDLLLVHVPTNRFVVVELKSGKFRPEHLGQLNFYVAAVNDLVKFPEDVSHSRNSGLRLQARADSEVRTGRVIPASRREFIYVRFPPSGREGSSAISGSNYCRA
ncbi:PDDEXK nuclease domain-containing protein [Paenarthrobacter nitroguajacolicus]|uniref:PDDEXK nuclease domain-containing protein n=1 Tax=Paenarthrobacter nitroguajacolicus TaxID=211146 RepID=UPI0027B9BB51|nr:PDDEXK nuclease domain-containing protein [Paenarthrobacter nitroguajacolicus]